MKVLFIANCHAKPMALIASAIAPKVKADFVEVNRLKDEDRDPVSKKIEEADIVFYYPISENWKMEYVRGSSIRATAKKSLSLTNIYFGGLHPDVTLIGKGGKRIQSPLSDYNSRIVAYSYLKAFPPEKALSLLLDPDFAQQFGYLDVWDESLAELKRRSDMSDVPFYEGFVEILSERLPLYVVNHPVTVVLLKHTQNALGHCGIGYDRFPEDCLPAYMLNNAIYPIFKYISANRGLAYHFERFKAPSKPEFIEPMDFVLGSYKSYSSVPEGELKIMDSHNLWSPKFSKIVS